MQHVIILPGWNHNSEHWQAFNPQGVATHVIDIPGFGKAPRDPKLHTVPEFAEYVWEKIIEITEITGNEGNNDHWVLLGHSFGGRIAAYLAATKENSPFEKMILFGTPLLYRPSQTVQLKSTFAGLVGKFTPSLLKRKFINSTDRNMAMQMGMYEEFKNAVQFDLTDLLPSITTPTLLLSGALDTEAPIKITKEAAKLIPNASTEIIPGEGHNIHITSPKLLEAHIRQFLQLN